MSITSVIRVDPNEVETEDCKPLFEDFKRGDHIITELNMEGTTDQTFYRTHYWLKELVTEWNSPGPGDIGSYSTNDDDSMATFHLIRTHSVEQGWRMDNEVNVYTLLQAALDEIWEKYEDEAIRPFRIWLPGSRSVDREANTCSPCLLGENKGVDDRVWEALGNTECELAVWLL